MSIFSRKGRLNRKLRNACSAGKLEEILRLLAEGADINNQDSDGSTPLVYAICSGRTEAVRLLAEKGADIHIPGCYGRSPLMSACSAGHEDIAEFLIQQGAKINVANPFSYNWTALHYAASSCESKESIISMLAQNGALVDIPDSEGDTPLHNAAYRGRFPAVKALVALGADINARNNKGDRPEERALSNGNKGVASFLQGKAAPAPEEGKGGWTLTAPDEVAFTAEKAAAGYCLTEIFNFNSRIYTQIARNLKTGAESQAVRFFDEFPDRKILEQAHRELTQRGGKADIAAIRGPSLDKKSL